MNLSGVERAIFNLYVIVGPGAWVLYSLMVWTGRARLRLGRTSGKQLPDAPPEVAILIPVKDEELRIADCVRSALAQDYPHSRVIAIDDRSTDRTGTLLDDIAVGEPRLTVLHIEPETLPDGWTGKCNALANGVRHTDAPWLLFIDSDVILEPHALRHTLTLASGRKYDLLSLLPRLECHTLWERLIVPLAGAALTTLHLISLTNDDNRKTAFANGQFILIRRSAYDAAGGHFAVRDQFCEDIEMARNVKRLGMRPRISWGAKLAAVRMYSSLESIKRGWARIFFAAARGRPWRAIFGIAFLLISGVSAYAAVAWGIVRAVGGGHANAGAYWLIAGGFHLVFMTIILSLFYSWTGNARRMAFAFPLGAAMLIAIFTRAIGMCRSGQVEWRGTRYGKTDRYSRAASGAAASSSHTTGDSSCPPTR